MWSRFTLSSVFAATVSQLVFLISYGFGALPLVASISAFVAGAVPNYLVNRRWTWQRRGRAGLRELLPYTMIVLGTFGIAALVTTVADSWADSLLVPHFWQVLLVGGAYLGTYGVMFVIKFQLFDRLVWARRPAAPPAQSSADRPEPARQAA